jgi:uncharacterized SAM-binding protein YcdF (DUF218 family)
MKRLSSLILKWLIPAAFLLFSLFFYTAVHGHSFLGLVCLCLAGVILCYYILDLLKKRFPKTVKVLSVLLTTVLCIGILVFAITEAIIIRASFGQPDANCEYIVVLGAKVNGTSPSLSLSDRIRAAEHYLKAHPDTIAVLSGGQGEDEGISEAQCMFDELTARGIESNRLWLEDKATSTWENLHFTLDLIEENTGIRPEKIGILSSEYHLFRASLFADESGVESVGIPAPTSRLSQKINHFMREVAGVWHYLILGGQYDA